LFKWKGCVMAQPVRRPSRNPASRFQCRASPRAMFGAQSDTGTALSRFSTNARHSSYIFTPTHDKAGEAWGPSNKRNALQKT
jgi:hypothetical protein